jgi:DNA helicase II / ATP-dependent DNA helicase PcrA
MSGLNPAQLEAVTNPLGNLLVLAGAGSGKTRVLINRIAWLLQETKAPLSSIFAVTFTNKAAGEMRSRLANLVHVNTYSMWVGTFHGLAHKLLRKHSELCNLPKTFQVIDSDDQLRLIKKVIKALNLNDEKFDPKKTQGFINRNKDEAKRSHQIPIGFNEYEQVMQSIYRHYELMCKDLQVIDFAELLLLSFDLLRENTDLLAHYQDSFQHFLVDEFQDTNTIQYEWLNLLANKAKSITVVGDDDQSIYGWRGAKIENIYKFEQDHPNTKIVKLEENYRSTGNILEAANYIIGNNKSRMGKNLWTKEGTGELITIYSALSEEDEALYLVRQIKILLDKGTNYNEIGVLYRSNAQSRILEEGLVRFGIPYVIYGGLRFFERAEIKDALAYLRLAQNFKDNASFERTINNPPRSIGDKSVEKIFNYAEVNNMDYFSAAQEITKSNFLTGKTRLAVENYVQLIEQIAKHSKTKTLAELMEFVILESGLLDYFKEQKGERAKSRVENLEELINATQDFILELDAVEQLGQSESTLTEFLAYTALDAGDIKPDKFSVQLMTLHSAKGLEFPVVFICGVEEGLFPSHFSLYEPKGVEEERRLCYVGITRAMQKLYLSYAKRRKLYGRDEQLREPSRFLAEIPKKLIDKQGCTISVVSGSYPKRNSFASTSTGDGYILGGQVVHSKFGVGTIIDLEGKDDKMRLHVHFESLGTKWLAPSKALEVC